MDRRNFLGIGTLSVLSAPKSELKPVEAHGTYLNLSHLTSIVSQVVRFEMSPAQWASLTTLNASVGDNHVAIGALNTIPIAINPDVPKDEIRLVAHDGTIMARITGLAIPTGF